MTTSDPKKLINCPRCMAHRRSDHDTSCPTCGSPYHPTDEPTLGLELGRALKSSRSLALATALGASLTMSACSGVGDRDPAVAVYGGPPITQDMGSDQDGDMADQAQEPKPNNVDMPVYGGPPGE